MCRLTHPLYSTLILAETATEWSKMGHLLFLGNCGHLLSCDHI